MMKKKLNIVLLGPPGSGKSVQSELLEKHFKLKRILMGDILRLEARRKTRIGKKIKAAMNKGKLVNSKIVMELAKKHIGKTRHGILFDGFPRDLYEARHLDKIMHVTHVFFVDVPKSLIIKRLSSRYECYCGMTYNLLTKKPRHNLTCDKCGRKLFRRDDDRPEIIKKRIAVYKKETLPVIKHYGNRLVKINGNQSISKVFAAIKKGAT